MVWMQIPGYEHYEISVMGDIRRVWNSCTRMMSLVRNKYGYYVVRLTSLDGKRKEFLVHKLMELVYMEKAPTPKHVVYHRNGDKLDNCINNLAFITRTELGKISGSKSKRRPVRKIDPESKEIVDFYPSAREAGRKNFMSGQSVCESCNRVNKTNIAPDGYIYKWDSRE